MTTQVIPTKPLKADRRGQHPNSRANLRPGNPPVDIGKHGYSLAAKLKQCLKKPLAEPSDDAPVGDHIVYATLKGALDLVPVAFKETWDRVEGKVPGDTPPQVNLNVLFVIGKGYRELPQQLIEGNNDNSDQE